MSFQGNHGVQYRTSIFDMQIQYSQTITRQILPGHQSPLTTSNYCNIFRLTVCKYLKFGDWHCCHPSSCRLSCYLLFLLLLRCTCSQSRGFAIFLCTLLQWRVTKCYDICLGGLTVSPVGAEPFQCMTYLMLFSSPTCGTIRSRAYFLGTLAI